jgi:hypothetical protein
MISTLEVGMFYKSIFHAMAIAALFVMSTAQASSQVFGDYTVHYNAFTTDTLQPSMAEAYNIVRSKNRGMFTLSVMKKDLAPEGKPVRANVIASASNLTGQFRKFNVREIEDGNTIYYISVFHVAHEEMLDFNIQIQPEGESNSFNVKFRQQFFTQ